MLATTVELAPENGVRVAAFGRRVARIVFGVHFLRGDELRATSGRRAHELHAQQHSNPAKLKLKVLSVARRLSSCPRARCPRVFFVSSASSSPHRRRSRRRSALNNPHGSYR